MKHLEVTILGQSYRLGCPENGEAGLLEAVAKVDREMSAIRDGGKVRARERIAVLAALNLAYLPATRDRRAAALPSGLPSAALLAEIDAQGDRLDRLIERLDDALNEGGRSS